MDQDEDELTTQIVKKGYVVVISSENTATERELSCIMYCFVVGGGGVYISIGTSVSFSLLQDGLIKLKKEYERVKKWE